MEAQSEKYVNEIILSVDHLRIKNMSENFLTWQTSLICLPDITDDRIFDFITILETGCDVR